MLKIKEHLNKYVMTDTLLTIRTGLYEEWGISSEVNAMTKEFIEALESKMMDTKWGAYNNPNIKHFIFEFDFWKSKFDIVVNMLNYPSDEECFRCKSYGSFNSEMNYKDKTMRLNLGAVRGIPYTPAFDDIIKHEIQHVYKIMNGGDIKSSDKLLSKSTLFNEEFYNKLLDIMNTSREYKIQKLSYALYSSFEFERNGFIGGMDAVFANMETKDIKREETDINKKMEYKRVNSLMTTECYKAYENILKVLDFIDEISDDEIYEVFGYYKHKIKRILEISKDKYLRSISKILYKYSNVWVDGRTLMPTILEGQYLDMGCDTFFWIL